MTIPKTGVTDTPKTPTGSTSPLHQERIAQQENTDNKPVIMACTPIPGHPGELLCNLMPETEVQKALSSVTTPKAGSTSRVSGEGNSTNPDAEVVETWVRSDGKAINVRAVECNGETLYKPVDTALSQDLPGDPRPATIQTAQHNPPVATQASRVLGKGKKSCPLSGRCASNVGRTDDQARNAGR